MTTITPTSYISIPDLVHCLQCFYDGSLDDISDLSRLYLPTYLMFPSNSLKGQLDSSLIKDAIAQQNPSHRFAIAYVFTHKKHFLELLEVSYIRSNSPLNFTEYIQSLYQKAIEDLAIIILKLL